MHGSRRVSTAGLLMLLCKTYPDLFIVFLLLLMLDLFSHWSQMYSTLTGGSATHKVSSWQICTILLHIFSIHILHIFSELPTCDWHLSACSCSKQVAGLHLLTYECASKQGWHVICQWELILNGSSGFVHPVLVQFYILLLHWYKSSNVLSIVQSCILLIAGLRMQDKHSHSFLVRLYYQKRVFMGFCCVSCEVLYLMVRCSTHTCQQWCLYSSCSSSAPVNTASLLNIGYLTVPWGTCKRHAVVTVQWQWGLKSVLACRRYSSHVCRLWTITAAVDL